MDAEDGSFNRQLSDPSFCRGKLMMAPQDVMQANGMSHVAAHVTQEIPDMNANVVDLSDEWNDNGKVTSYMPMGADQGEQQSPTDGETTYGTHRQGTITSKQPKSNPCKGMRARYRKLVERLLQQVRLDPCGVAYEEIQAQLPPSVVKNEWLKSKLLSRLRQEQARLLQTGYSLQ